MLPLLLLLLLAPPTGAKRRKGSSASAQHVNNRKRECEAEVCEDVHEDERGNCVLQCQSEQCFEEVYAAEPLEPGEIDMKRQRTFQNCLNAESRRAAAERFQRNQQKAKSVAADDPEQEAAGVPAELHAGAGDAKGDAMGDPKVAQAVEL